ncbi:MAG: PEP-utilizing enzyme, partial [Ligilactobacillus acidipiscis]|nr:PEP-utilizing enzyme [Ligilactobacillus acidipiscis]
MTKMLKGIAASDGIAVAKAYMLVQPDLSFSETKIDDPEAEIARLNDAVAASKKELEVIKTKAAENLGDEEAQVFEAHLTILSDPEMLGQISDKIKNDKVNAEAAVKSVTDMFIQMFEGMTDNTYMQERAGDVRDVTKRLMSHLLGVTLPSPALINEEVVIVAHDLTPSDTAQLDRKYVKGFITDIGGRTSHSAIMSRTLEIPAIVGSGSATDDIKADQTVIIDGINGDALVDPSDAELKEYKQKADDFAAQKAEWAQLKNEQSVTADGKQVTLGANIGTPKDV